MQRYKLNSSDICTVHKFDEKGATISIAADKPNALACLTMINAVFQLLSEVLYKRYREEKRFVLQTRSAIASKVEEMQLSSVQAAERLTQHLVAKESALHVPNTLLKDVSDHFQLVSMPNPTNVLTRHAFVVNGMDAESAELAQTFRTEILKSKQSKAS